MRRRLGARFDIRIALYHSERLDQQTPTFREYLVIRIRTMQLQRELDLSNQQLAEVIQSSPASISKAKARWNVAR